MKKQNFLNKLKHEGALELVEPSNEIAESYLNKSSNSLSAAQILLDSKLLEEATSMAYYAMYHCLAALMRKCGIKCENHAGNIVLLKELFKEAELYESISSAKEKRIDMQYYISSAATEESVAELIEKAQDFTIKIKYIVQNLKGPDIDRIRKNFGAI